MTSELDEFFGPRRQYKQKPTQRRTGIIENPWAQVERKPRQAATPRKSVKIGKLGEDIARDVLKKFGIRLTKIPLRENYYGYTSIDVDFQGSYHNRPLKVEAKAWWTKGGENNFPLTRFSKNERGYMRRGMEQGFQCWITLAYLDTEPTRKACDALYVIPWAEWLQIEAALLERATGNYKGRSLRVRDLDLLEGYAIVKQSRRWTLPAEHWMNEEER